MSDAHAEPRAIVALDIESWSGRTALDQRGLQDDLHRLVDESLVAAGIDPSIARRQRTGDGVLLSLPARVSKASLTQPFVHELDEVVRRHLYEAPALRRMRLRLALHTGDIVDDGDDWQGAAVVEACRLLDADVLRRALRAATTSVLAVVLSARWYDDVVRDGRVNDQGYRHVRAETKDATREAWVRVPGLNEPPGLGPGDQWPEVPPQQRPDTPVAELPAASGGGNHIGTLKIGKLRNFVQGDHANVGEPPEAR